MYPAIGGSRVDAAGSAAAEQPSSRLGGPGGVEEARSVSGIDRRSFRPSLEIDAAFMDVLLPELPRLRRVARLLVGSGDVADDLVAEALVRTLTAWRAGRVEELVRYTRVTIYNLAAKRWRRFAVRRRLDHRAIDWTSEVAAADDVTAERDRVLSALTLLAPRRRAVVVLRFYEDRSTAEIADLLGCSVGTVKSQLSRALEQLAVLLEGPDKR